MRVKEKEEKELKFEEIISKGPVHKKRSVVINPWVKH